MDDDEEFTYALKTVLRDLRAQCSVQPDIREDDDEPNRVMLYAPDGSGQGVYAEPDGRSAMLLAHVADQVQEWAVEALWAKGEPAAWPACPTHPGTHPLAAAVEDGEPGADGDEKVAVWVCPGTGLAAARIGALPVTESGGGRRGRASRRGRRGGPLRRGR